MKILDYNKERKSSNASFYIKAMLLGALLGVILVVLGIGFVSIIKLIIKYWIYVLVILLLAFLVRRYLFRPKVSAGSHGNQ